MNNQLNFSLNLPFNSLSFGQVSYAIVREIYKRGLAPCIFPIGTNVDLGAYKKDDDFNLWLQSCINKSIKRHDRNNPTVKLWHINGSLESFSKDQILITFNELDSLTEFEINILKNQKLVFVTSNYTKQVFEDHGLNNVKYLPLGFDSENFYKINHQIKDEGVVNWGVYGKAEPLRKVHDKIIRGWLKKFGNQKGHILNLAIYNPHLKPEDNEKLVHQILEGKKYWNINLIPWMQTNIEYNQFINNNDIVLSPFRGEGRDLPTFHSVGLGKHCLSLRAHAYLDYLNDENAVLINPSGKIKAVDNIFFYEGQPFNNGNLYDWQENDYLNALDVVLERFKNNPINEKGLELQKITYSDTVDTILKEI